MTEGGGGEGVLENIITFTESLSHGVLFQLPLCVAIQLHHNTKYVQQQSF